MDPRSLSCSICVVLLCLLGGIRCSNAGPCQCPCPQPPLLDLTEPPQASDCCQRNGMFRYTCIDGYVRKAGSSNLIRCKQTDPGPKWSTSTLSCIPDPKRRTTTQQPKITLTTFSTTNSEITSNTSIHQVNRVRDIGETDIQTANSSSSPATIKVLDRNNPESHQGSRAIGHGLSALGALIVICALLSGIGFVCYKRRSRSNNQQQQQQPEEMRPINREENVPRGLAP